MKYVEHFVGYAGLILSLIGAVWLLIDCGETFTAYQHQRWIEDAQRIPTGESVSRDDAIALLRNASLRLNGRHRFVLIPGGLMFLGSMLLFVSWYRRQN